MCFRVKLVIKVRKFWTELFLISKLVLKISVQSDETTDVENCRQMIALVRSRAWWYHNNRFLILWRYEKIHQSKRHLLMSKRKLPNITWTSKLLVLCVLTVPLLCLEINKFCIAKTGHSAVGGYSLFSLSTYFSIKNTAFKNKKFFDISVKAINWIKGRAFNHCHFKSFCQDYSRDSLLMNKKFYFCIRNWLLRGKALTRFFELRN